MTTINFPSILVPLVGLVFPAIAMASLFLHVQKKQDCLSPVVQISVLKLNHNTFIYLAEW
ncbi:hypothetical protein RND81_O173100 [Saponaria officinalis]|uniref:Photosystem I reaction center subunit VIII n=1 Tax=Saponaria officinalis TaxID=3572 RepID=A0AAW1GDW6_SAPOF